MGTGNTALNSILLFGIGVSLGGCIARWISKRNRYDGLDGVVSQSSRVIAAWRAIETLEEDRLFSDPFALALAGQKAFKQALDLAQSFEGDTSAAPWRRKYKISNVASRVWWFDRQILSALSAPRPATKETERLEDGTGQEPIVEKIDLDGHTPSHQNVVVLGSGMDTRPWRLDLPAGVHWFEIDRKDVLEAKQKALKKIGAQFSNEDQPSAVGGTQHPLRAESWAAVEADLCSPGWAQKLQDAGFDPGRPTVWVVEGLIMYLTPDEAGSLLKAIAEVSVPGSTVVIHNISDELVRLIEAGEVDYHPFSMELMKTWYFGFPQDPTEMLKSASWQLEQAISRAQIAHEITGGEAKGKCDFETNIGSSRDRFSVFVVARK